MPLRICFIASEVTPLSKTGGLADVTGALVKFLHGAGHDVRLFTPFYSQIDRSKFVLTPVEGLRDVPLEVGTHRYRYTVWRARLPGSQAQVFLIECPQLYSRPSLYTFEPDEHRRFIALTRAAFEICQRVQWSPQILHCHDWHTGFAPLLLKYAYSWDRLFKDTRSVFTIHNIGYQGVFSARDVSDLALGANQYLLHQDDLHAGMVNPLKHGILYADAVTTVSPTYAREICDELGMGMQAALRTRGAAVTGILNGVDYHDWDPRTDRYITRHYDSRRIATKLVLKTEFLKRLGLTSGARTPLAGIVTRLAEQKGVDLMFETLPRILQTRGLAFVALGSGEPKYEKFFTVLQQEFPERVHFNRGYDEPFAHWVEAASDLFLMPSRYEPCGLNQLYSLRYGTVPVVRRTGGLADSIQQYDPATKHGTGVLFDEFTPEAFEAALGSTLDLYENQTHWRQMVRNGMRQDFSWAKQGKLYVELYEKLLTS